MSKHTPGPWIIDWYECRADLKDVKAKTAKRVGEVLWRVPTSIGPVSSGQNHWAGLHLDVSEDDARLIAAAPELLAIAQRVSEWERKYPAHRIYSEGKIRSIAVEMTAIVEDADAVIAKVEGEKA